MASLKDLPLELILLIIPYLLSTSVKALSLCSHHFRAPLIPHIYLNLHLSFDNYVREKSSFLFDNLFNRIRSCVKHVTISAPDPLGLDIENLLDFFRTSGLLLHMLDRLISLKVIYVSSQDVIQETGGFDNYVFSLLFCPSDSDAGAQSMEKKKRDEGADRSRLSHYKTLRILHIQITIVQENWYWRIEGQKTMTQNQLKKIRTELLQKSIDLDSKHSFRPPSLLPALHEFSVKAVPQNLWIWNNGEAISTHPIFNTRSEGNLLSLLSGSFDSLKCLNIWMRIGSSFGPLIWFPTGFIFPNVKQLRFNSRFIMREGDDMLEFGLEGECHLIHLDEVAPNAEDLAVYLERSLLGNTTMREVDMIFEEFREGIMLNLRTVRLGWPHKEAYGYFSNAPRSEWVQTQELGEKILGWKYGGLEKLESVVFVRLTGGEKTTYTSVQASVAVEGFEAITGVVCTAKNGLIEVVWSDLYREKLLDIEEQDWLKNNRIA